MTLAELSDSTQNYLKAIWVLQEWDPVPVTASALAAKTGLKISTVSGALRKLAEQELIDHASYGTITLTPRGREYALAMVRRHRLLETFLVEVLNYRWDQVHDEAERLEHSASDFMIAQIAARLGHPRRDPHGDPIPSATGKVVRPDTVLLSDLPPGACGAVARIADGDPAVLQYLTEHSVGLDAVLTRLEPAPFSEAVRVALPSGTDLALSPAAASAIRVTASPAPAPPAKPPKTAPHN